MDIEEKLFLNRFKVDNNNPHLSIKDKTRCQQCSDKPCMFVCPVKNYKKTDGTVELSWEGCLECGSCRIACPAGVIEWRYPGGGFGIIYKFG